jgi:hypothetical protein
MPPKSKRGGAAAGSNSGSARKGCKPVIQKLPTDLLPLPHPEDVPEIIKEKLAEFRNAQSFFSIIEKVYPELVNIGSLNKCWLGYPNSKIVDFRRTEDDSFNGEIEYKHNSTTISCPIFIKRAHILDPILTIEGECIYPIDGGLPAPAEIWSNTLQKITDPLNEAYVDSMFALIADRLVTTNVSPHWCHCFGTFSARVEKYHYNISEEYPSLKNKPYWKKNMETGLFKLHVTVEEELQNQQGGLKQIISEAQDLNLDDFDTVEVEIQKSIGTTSTELALAESDVEEEELGKPIKLNTPRVRLSKLSSADDEEQESSEDEEDEDDDDGGFNNYYAEFSDFPVQVTLLEKMEGVMDDLLEIEFASETEKDSHWTAWFFQVIAALTTAQHLFGFVHNDLHSNNVMWNKTDIQYLYYRVHKGNKSWIMRVPTYGYLIKIIDFGRASFWLPNPAGFIISDAFYPGNDATDQYNCEPFFDPKVGKKIEPNPSFDLCRLAVSLIEAIYAKTPEVAKPLKIMSREDKRSYSFTVSPLYNLLWSWLTDDEDKNVLRGPNGVERYPSFDLYAAIASDVHKAVPNQQIEKPIFSEYVFNEQLAESQKIYELWIR